MSKEKQIVEIKECIDAVYGADCAYFDVDGFAIADKIYNAGYHKQKEGKWIKRGNEKKCSHCEFIYYSNNDDWSYCPNCGARMKGGAE